MTALTICTTIQAQLNAKRDVVTLSPELAVETLQLLNTITEMALEDFINYRSFKRELDTTGSALVPIPAWAADDLRKPTLDDYKNGHDFPDEPAAPTAQQYKDAGLVIPAHVIAAQVAADRDVTSWKPDPSEGSAPIADKGTPIEDGERSDWDRLDPDGSGRRGPLADLHPAVRATIEADAKRIVGEEAVEAMRRKYNAENAIGGDRGVPIEPKPDIPGSTAARALPKIGF